MSALCSGEVRNLALSCKKLESFSFQYFEDCEGADILKRGHDLTPREITEELEPCRQTSQHLEVSDWDGRTILQRNDRITNLQQFPALRTLVLDEICLVSGEQKERPTTGDLLIRLLPASIESVVLKEVHLSLYDDMMELAWKAQNGLFPHLKYFKAIFKGMIPSRMHKPLEEAFRKAGISFAS